MGRKKQDSDFFSEEAYEEEVQETEDSLVEEENKIEETVSVIAEPVVVKVKPAPLVSEQAEQFATVVMVGREMVFVKTESGSNFCYPISQYKKARLGDKIKI